MVCPSDGGNIYPNGADRANKSDADGNGRKSYRVFLFASPVLGRYWLVLLCRDSNYLDLDGRLPYFVRCFDKPFLALLNCISHWVKSLSLIVAFSFLFTDDWQLLPYLG